LVERLDVPVGEVAGEVLFDSVTVVSARTFHRLATVVGEQDEDRPTVVLRADTADETGRPHAVDNAGEAALAQQDPLG
jgi:hypothetical protein